MITFPKRPGRSTLSSVALISKDSSPGKESEDDPEAATEVAVSEDAPRQVLRASESLRQWTTCQSECEPPRLPAERAGQGKEEGTQETRPQGTLRKGQRPEVG